MKAIVVIMLCAIALHAEARSSKSDEINKYIINGKNVENFDGSQLKNLKITDYKIETEKQGKEDVKIHKITVENSTPVISIGGNKTMSDIMGISVIDAKGNKIMIPENNFDKFLFIIDGVKSDKKKIPDNIESFEIIKDEPDLLKQYGDEAKNGVVLIKTKGTATNVKTIFIMNNDRELSEENFKKLSPKDITSMNVLRGEKAREYLKSKDVKTSTAPENVDVVVKVELKNSYF